jgi:hypothetical protein
LTVANSLLTWPDADPTLYRGDLRMRWVEEFFVSKRWAGEGL